MAELSTIKGIGPARVKTFKKAGISSIEELAGSKVEDLEKKTKIPAKMLKPLIADAKKQLKSNLVTKDKKPVFVADVLGTLADLHQRVAALEMRMQTMETQTATPVPEHIERLSKYVKEHLSTWTDDHIFAFLEEHGHPDHDIAAALNVARK